MNLLEAIQGAGDNWFRPIPFRKGAAYRIDEFGFIQFKSNHGNQVNFTFTSDSKLLTGEWEIVTPEQVLAERKS